MCSPSVYTSENHQAVKCDREWWTNTMSDGTLWHLELRVGLSSFWPKHISGFWAGESSSCATHWRNGWVCFQGMIWCHCLSITLHHVLVNIYGMTKRNAARMIGNLIGKNERTVQEWRKSFNDNGIASLTVSKATLPEAGCSLARWETLWGSLWLRSQQCCCERKTKHNIYELLPLDKWATPSEQCAWAS